MTDSTAPVTGTAAIDSATRERADRLIEQGNAAEDAGDLRGACARYREAVAFAPAYARAHLNLGIGLEATGDVDGAIAAFAAALACDPASAPASYNLGRHLYLQGALPRAAELLRAAITHRADFPQAHVVLSSVYDAQGNLEAAAQELEAALQLRPDASALVSLGLVLKRLGRADEAQAALRQALLLQPGFPEALFTLADLHDAEGDLDAAAAALETALAARPDWAEALNNYGDLLQRLQRLPEAEAALRHAIAVAPQLSNAHQTLGAILVNEARVPEALEVLRRGRERDPDSFHLESAELFALNLSDDISAADVHARHVAFGRRLEAAHPARFLPFQNSRDLSRRLRIGYLSSDFCNHGVALFALPLIERHDRSFCEVHCYSVGAVTDGYTREVERRADRWTNAASLSHDQLADAIHRDGIDILVDLAGHSGSRLPVFAQQPSPVAVSWLGYLNTTGLSRIHYRLCDIHTDPAGAEQLYSETLVRLPASQWCYRPRPGLEYARPEAAPFARNGFVTFGSFNHTPKLSASIRALWARILTQVPESRLVLVGVPEGPARQTVIEDFARAGVAPARLTIAGRVPIQEYFRWFNTVDLALDTTPYSGGTTTCDALWMGVPVLTIPGERPMSRSAAGILSVVGLAEWIASSPDDYVLRAVEFGRSGGARSDQDKTVRQRMQASPLMDEARFARDVEAAYQRMWQVYCHDDTARGFRR